MPVKNPMDSPLTVLASLDTESKALDLNIVFPFRKCGKIAVDVFNGVAQAKLELDKWNGFVDNMKRERQTA